MSRYRQPLRYIGRQWRHLVGILAVTGVSAAVAALEPWPLKILIDHALGARPLPAPLARAVVLAGLPLAPSTLVAAAALASLALFAVTASLNIAVSWLWAVAGQRMVFHLSTDLFHRLQRLSLAYHARTPVGDSLTRLTGDTWSVYTLTNRLFTPFEQALTLVTIGAIAWRLNPRLALFALGAAPLLAASSLFFGRRLKRRAREGREAHGRLASFVHQTLSALPVVQAFTAEARHARTFERLADDVVHLAQRGTLIGGAHSLVNGLLTTTGTAAILCVGGLEVLAGKLSVGGLVVFLTYVRKFQYAAEALLKTYGAVKPVEAGIDRVFEVLESGEDEVRDRPGAPALPPSGRGVDLRFEQVTFGYERGAAVLHGVDLAVRAGETVALVGATGAGKSTLVSLIPRFYDVWAGRVLWDGADVREVKVASLRAQIAIVLQEPFLFPLTVAENIGYGRPGATPEEIQAAARAANADEFIRRLPEGYATVLGDRGNTLSGGERQRIAIARAILKDAPVILLDEPTSALDAATEAAVVEALARLTVRRTTVIIAHRLSTTVRADKIAVLHEGRIIDCGTHQELAGRSAIYRRLYPQQGAARRRGARG
jgi:ATP-binding cassette subfamily B protein/subfamily B ATP-binding cassette protein MsbA